VNLPIAGPVSFFINGCREASKHIAVCCREPKHNSALCLVRDISHAEGVSAWQSSLVPRTDGARRWSHVSKCLAAGPSKYLIKRRAGRMKFELRRVRCL